jgi:hypothetical protein
MNLYTFFIFLSYTGSFLFTIWMALTKYEKPCFLEKKKLNIFLSRQKEKQTIELRMNDFFTFAI